MYQSRKAGEQKMEVDLIFKIAAVGILVAVLNILLSRSGREEQGLMVTLAGLLIVLGIIIQKVSDLFHLIQTLFQF
jgi:stage III sporulation protein AC